MSADTKTTVFGIVAAVAAACLTPQAVAMEPHIVQTIAGWVLSVGLGLLGYHAAGADSSK